MYSEKLRLSLICILIYVVVAGFVTQIGLLTGPIASAYNKEVTSATAIFHFSQGVFWQAPLLLISSWITSG